MPHSPGLFVSSNAYIVRLFRFEFSDLAGRSGLLRIHDLSIRGTKVLGQAVLHLNILDLGPVGLAEFLPFCRQSLLLGRGRLGYSDFRSVNLGKLSNGFCPR